MDINKNSGPSNRKFGFFFASVFLFLSAYTGFIGLDSNVAIGWFTVSITVGLIAKFTPSLLTPFNWLWMKLGDFMGMLISPVILGIIFYVLITPVGVVTRLFGRDELRIKKINTNTYWINRTPPGPSGESFKNQF
jgi:hypothetical protein